MSIYLIIFGELALRGAEVDYPMIMQRVGRLTGGKYSLLLSRGLVDLEAIRIGEICHSLHIPIILVFPW